MVAAVAMWLVTGSPFALLGAVLAPTMVVAHFADARRRATKDTRTAERTRQRDESVRALAAQRRFDEETRELSRRWPSIATIASHSEWVPPRRGETLIRAGHLDTGRPWLVDIASGVSVVGNGPAANAVWDSLLVHATSQLGTPTGDDRRVRWQNGAWLARDSAGAGLSIRCVDDRIVSVTERGSTPTHGDWRADDVRAAEDVRARLTDEPVSAFEFEFSSDEPHLLIAGRTGSGKSRALSALIRQWCARRRVTELTFVGFDFKGGATLGPLMSLQNFMCCK